MSDSSQVSLAFKEGVTFGLIPSGALQELRFTGETLKQNTRFVVSDEIRDDRQITDVSRTGFEAAGAINGRVSYGNWDQVWKAALLSGAWGSQVAITSTLISFVAGTNKIVRSSGSFITDGFVANLAIRVISTSGTNDGYFIPTTVTALEITVAPTATLSTESAGTSVKLRQGGQIVNGTTLTTLIVEKEFTDIANEFTTMLSLAPNTLDFRFSSEDLISTSVGFLGKAEIQNTATCGTGANVAAPTGRLFNATDHVARVLESTEPFRVTDVQFQLTNNIRALLEVGAAGATDLGKGQVNITGRVQAYFRAANRAAYQRYLGFTEGALTFALDRSDQGYVVDMPYVQFTDGRKVAERANGDVLIDMAYNAFMHPTQLVTVRILRFDAEA